MSAVVMANWPRWTAMPGGVLRLHPYEQTGCDVELLDVCALAQHALALMRATGRVRGVDVRMELPEEPLFAQVSRRVFEQALYHLIAYAVDAQEAAGDRAGAVRVRVEPPDAFGDTGAAVHVQHAGQSLSESELLAIFAPSVPVAPSLQGLVRVREQVESMGGQLTLRSHARRGTTFTMELLEHEGCASW